MENRDTIYICTKIFNYSDKIQAECLETELKKQLNLNTFMPFRDTGEKDLKGENRAKIIYESDIEKLESGKIALLAVLYDGICKDEGISFEIGYAFGRNIPIFVINTDFIWYAVGEKEYCLDPVIEYMASSYMQYYSIENKGNFKEALIASQTQAFSNAAKKISLMIGKREYKNITGLDIDNHIDVFIDFGGGKYEYQREYALQIKNELSQYNIKVEMADRYCKLEEIDNLHCGLDDIKRLLASDCYVCLGDEVELSSGTAALLGLAKSNNKKIILYESSNVKIHGENGHQMKKNLMIDFSVDVVAKRKEEIVDIILKGKKNEESKSREKEFEKLKENILQCNICKEKFGFDPHPIIMGNVNSKIIQISQAPSQNVHNTLKPFDDASGRKLRNEWYKIPDEVFYNPDNFYIAAIAHCYPGKSPSGGDRLPPKKCAEKWLLKELELIDNEIFILLGGKAAGFFFPKQDFTSLIFKDNVINGKTAYVLPHPSPLNAKWFKDNPDFLKYRILEIEEKVHKVLGV